MNRDPVSKHFMSETIVWETHLKNRKPPRNKIPICTHNFSLNKLPSRKARFKKGYSGRTPKKCPSGKASAGENLGMSDDSLTFDDKQVCLETFSYLKEYMRGTTHEKLLRELIDLDTHKHTFCIICLHILETVHSFV